MTLPVSYEWFILISRLTIASLFILFLWQILRALLRDAFESAPTHQLQFTPINGGRPMPLRRARPMTVGRDDDCDAVIPDPSVSGRHARVTFDGVTWVVTDLDSTNGTWLNGARLAEPTRIETSDVVQFGRFYVQVTVVDADGDVIGADRAGKR